MTSIVCWTFGYSRLVFGHHWKTLKLKFLIGCWRISTIQMMVSGPNTRYWLITPKDKLENMDVSLTFCHFPKLVMWKLWSLSFQNNRFVADQVVRSQRIDKVECFLTFFVVSLFPTQQWKQNRDFFPKCSYLNLIKMHKTNCKWP